MKRMVWKSFMMKVWISAMLVGTLPAAALSASAETTTPPPAQQSDLPDTPDTAEAAAPNVVIVPAGSESVLVTGPATTKQGATFHADVALSGVTGKVAAQKYIVSFNPAKTEWVGAEAVHASVSIIDQQAALGEATIVATSTGETAVTGETLIRLTFKAKAASGIQDIQVGAELGLADNGAIQEVRQGLLSVRSNLVSGDLNGNDRLDIGDLAILAPYYGIDSSHEAWPLVANADFNQNGTIDLTDLGTLGRKVLYDDAPFELMEATVTEIQSAMNAGKVTAVELVTAYLARIEAYDQQGPELKSIITVNPKALEEAAALDEERTAQGPRGPLHGIPVIVKDNFNTIGMPTTAGCICLKDNYTPTDAFMITKLKEAGAIILAKSNLHEFAFGTSTISSLGGQTKNPYVLSTHPGGSSGGTGAALAANFGVIGLGTDTGGSIRIPSSRNALVGIRPTIGLTSREGIIPLALSQDVGGPMTRTVADAAIMLDVLAGYDPNDTATSMATGHIPASYTDYLDVDGLSGARIGFVRSLSTGNDPAVEAALAKMRELGAEIIEIASLPNQTQILAYNSLSGTEFKFDLNNYLASLGDAAPYKTLSDILANGEVLQSQRSSMVTRNNVETLETLGYYRDLWQRTKLTQQTLNKVFTENKLDALLYASTSGSANRLSPYSGFPAISFPGGYISSGNSAGLPFGLEFLGREYDEGTIIKLAFAYEQATMHRIAPASTPVLPEPSEPQTGESEEVPLAAAS
ncbi:amidase family protein [Paenibacillus daejeonensis]|uniref:amidase family protein n=1 Tax=Paenibacillus daejeonensis TaxID=135193 RepID=UPI00035CF71C|nr:amidase family protein [Paenibacillus daejeonensis]